MKVRMALPDKKSLGIIALLAGGIIGLFFLWGLYGTSLTLFIGFSIWLMLLAALTPIRDKAQWVYVFMLISGAAALFTLNRLYNPSIKVFSNAQHHALNLTGFETDAHDIALMGAEISKGSPYILRYHSAQPVYARLTGNKDSLLNKASLPYFDKSFTLSSSAPDITQHVVAFRNMAANMHFAFEDISITFTGNDRAEVTCDFFYSGDDFGLSVRDARALEATLHKDPESGRWRFARVRLSNIIKK